MSAYTLISQATSFIGRESELAEIASLLFQPDCRLLTLTGLGGIGKTSLAAQAAQAFEVHYFVPLQPLSSIDNIVPAIANTLKFMFYDERDPKTQLLDYLHDKQALLVLDNFEHLLDGADLLPEILEAAPQVKLLVTSRERLNLREEWVLEIRGLSFPDGNPDQPLNTYAAVQLFAQSAKRAGYTLQDNDNAAVTRICRVLEGIPLAIELAAGWVHALVCEQIANEIERSLDLLSTNLRNFPEKHRSIRAVFEHSWSLLSETEKNVFMKMSIFRGGFTREAGEQVGETSLATLALLVGKSLLRRGDTGRYSLQELLRQFAEEQLKASGEWEAVCNKHSTYYATFLSQKWQLLRGREQPGTLLEIDNEFENIRVAWRWMAEQQSTAELGMSVYPLWYFSDLRGRYLEATAMFKQAEELLSTVTDDAETARLKGVLMCLRGGFCEALKQPAEGLMLLQNGLEILELVGSSLDVAMAYYLLCPINGAAGDHAAVRRSARQFASIAQRTGDPWLEALALGQLFWNMCFLDSDNIEAIKRTGFAFFNAAESCGDPTIRAESITAQLTLCNMEGRHIEAQSWGNQLLTLLEETGHTAMLADAHRHQACIYLHLNDSASAASHFQQSLKLLSERDDYVYSLAFTLNHIAEMWADYGNKARAIKLFAFFAYSPTSLQWERDNAVERLLALEREVPAHIFADARQHGKALEFKVMVQEVIEDLAKTTQSVTSEDALNGLSPRELDILRLAADGLSNKEIAHRLFLSVNTVRWYLREIYSKLSTHTRVETILLAKERNLLV